MIRAILGSRPGTFALWLMLLAVDALDLLLGHPNTDDAYQRADQPVREFRGVVVGKHGEAE